MTGSLEESMRHILLLFMLIAIAVPLCAQSDANKGQMVGTVYDPVQAVVPNAKVQVQNKATGPLGCGARDKQQLGGRRPVQLPQYRAPGTQSR